MPSGFDYLSAAASAAAVLACVYVVCQSLLVRGTLAPGPYRSHALGMGFIAGLVALSHLTNYLPSTEGLWFYAVPAVVAALDLGVVYWVDSSILTARRSDPLYRDTFHWGAVRKLVWGETVAAVLIVVVLGIAAPHSPGSQAPFGPQIPQWAAKFFTALFYSPLYVAAFCGAVVIPVAARRCRDRVFRQHLEWFIVFIVIQLAIDGVLGQFFQGPGGSHTALGLLIDGIGILMSAYPLYLSVRKLVPLYRFESDATEGEAAPASRSSNGPAAPAPSR